MHIGAGTWFQREYCKQYGVRAMQPYKAGDLLFFMDDNAEVPSHAGIATGLETVIEETASVGNVTESEVAGRWDRDFVEGWRIV